MNNNSTRKKIKKKKKELLKNLQIDLKGKRDENGVGKENKILQNDTANQNRNPKFNSHTNIFD